jgi:hypothetical protein
MNTSHSDEFAMPWWRRIFHRCPLPAPVQGQVFRCQECGRTWDAEYQPDIVAVTDGVMDAGGEVRWFLSHSDSYAVIDRTT